jgi:hypothetical protein
MLVLIHFALISVITNVLCGCESWSVTLSEEHRLRALENRVLRWMFGLKRDDAAKDWRRLHDEELYDHYSLQILFG